MHRQIEPLIERSVVSPPCCGADTATSVSSGKVVLSLGSNQGDSIWYLRRALRWLREIPRLEITAVSSVYCTAPVDYLAQPDFLNAVVIGNCSLVPHTLLAFTQAIEQRLGRVRTIAKGPRTIDIDIIDYGGRRLRSPELTIPHPRSHQRAFVLIPWAEVDSSAPQIAVSDFVVVRSDFSLN
ncbi:MAG: 2-amino-4-hydroxy-6-hydroxymethyldihydropteridine diphosphokinase [Propionibacteriaceae bacterium]|jgi:2-amino-4-hydroxy-6-hydroxymethyldihydropteridine diphosphokinase|nr:2-amino-4-hydroxy-6-hydroxymethyldihydropteridine diphosphokinase [Propionibacteriaceae bacterium]